MKTFRLLFLGAGFSRSAGLPLGQELFTLVRQRLSRIHGADNKVERDIARYVEFRKECFGESITLASFDGEQFMSFLDNEHYLGLKGKDTWSADGNESQIMIRTAIAQVLDAMTPSNVPDAYRRFAAQINGSDYLFTFNYDILLERAFEVEGIPYRLFPDRYSSVSGSLCYIDTASFEEVTLLKMHGSIDWFSKRTYDQHVASVRESSIKLGGEYVPGHPIFGPDKVTEATPLTSGPRLKDDPLNDLYRVKDVEKALSQPFWKCSPFILSPSATKLYYVHPIVDFWRGLQASGGLNLSVGIIGYSLPHYDDYALQAIYYVTKNYQYAEPNFAFEGRTKSPIRIIDYQTTTADQSRFRKRFGFLDWSRTEAMFTGFDSQSADWILS